MKKKILFFLPSMFGGGAERVVLTILKDIDRQNFDPSLVLLKKEGRYLDDVPKDIKIIDLDVKQARYSLFKIYTLIKSEKPDIVFTSLAHLNLLIALIRPLFSKDIKFIARESNTVSQNNRVDKYPKINDFLYKRVYKNYDLIVTQAKAMRDDLRDNYGIDNKRMKIIYNPVDFDTIIKRSKESDPRFDKDRYNLLAVGRLSYQKGFDMAIKIVKNLDDSYCLNILGDGDGRDELEELIRVNHLENRVKLLGFNDNPYAFMRDADLFILSSRYEGLPNVVLEANVLGLPVVAFNSSGGTAEIIDDGVNGFLVEAFDIDKFSKKIKEAREYNFDKEKISINCKKNFDSKRIVKEYERLFSNS